MSAASASTSHSWPPHSLHSVPAKPEPAEHRAEVADRRGHAAVGVVEVPELQVEGADERQDAAQVRRSRSPEPHQQVHVQGVDPGGTAPDRSNSDDGAQSSRGRASRRRGGSRRSGAMPPLRELGEVGRRQCRHQHADVHEQAHVRVVHSGDHLDRLGGRRRVGRLLPLDLLVQHEVQVVQRGQEPSQEGVAGLADRKSHAGRPHAARGTQLRQQEREALRLVAPLSPDRSQSSRLAPTMLTLPPAASRSRRSASTSASAGDGERPPQLARARAR